VREAIQSLVGAMERDRGGLAIVSCPDLRLRETLVEEVESLTPTEALAFRTSDVRTAIAAPDRRVLLIPDNEREVVLDLDGCREQALDPPRSQPIILFLIRGGDGFNTLATHAPSLWSWARGNDVDPERLAEIDVDHARAEFEQRTGMTPEQWLALWRDGTTPRTDANYALTARALLLESR
jgi:hypothetical protein